MNRMEEATIAYREAAARAAEAQHDADLAELNRAKSVYAQVNDLVENHGMSKSAADKAAHQSDEHRNLQEAVIEARYLADTTRADARACYQTLVYAARTAEENA